LALFIIDKLIKPFVTAFPLIKLLIIAIIVLKDTIIVIITISTKNSNTYSETSEHFKILNEQAPPWEHLDPNILVHE
jgi:hypothetical protein